MFLPKRCILILKFEVIESGIQIIDHIRIIIVSSIAGLVVWSLASGAQGPHINTRPGHYRFGQDEFRFFTNSDLVGSI